MATAHRTIVIDDQEWKHWVHDWLHTLELDDKYSIRWVSGHSEESVLFVGGERQRAGAQMKLVAQVHKELGHEMPEEFMCKFSKYFVMWPFYVEHLDDDDNRQLNDLPPENEEEFATFAKLLQQDNEDRS